MASDHAKRMLFTWYVATLAFCIYTCIYSFRKTFSVGVYEVESLAGISYKVWLVVAQVFGYALSKFIGITFVSELHNRRRAHYLIVFSIISVLSWLFFAITPPPYAIGFLFVNGLHLGIMWGILFSYLEGRQCTEALAAGLSVSFIFSSGFVKSVGAYLMVEWNVAELWMPLATSLLFLLPLLVLVSLIERIPPPSAEDVTLRSKRLPMRKKERARFFTSFWPGITAFVLAYLLLTAFRDFRDNFSAELWAQLGTNHSVSIFTLTEVPITLIVLVTIALMMYVKHNPTAFAISHVIVIAGFGLIGVSTLLFELGMLPSVYWMILVGLGLYLGYVPFNSIFFERMLATFKYVGTVGFIMYLSDSVGYLGSIIVLLVKELGFGSLSWLQFFVRASYWVAAIGSLLMMASWIYFSIRQRSWKNTTDPVPEVALATS